jgi:hypothetical protein
MVCSFSSTTVVLRFLFALPQLMLSYSSHLKSRAIRVADTRSAKLSLSYSHTRPLELDEKNQSKLVLVCLILVLYIHTRIANLAESVSLYRSGLVPFMASVPLFGLGSGPLSLFKMGVLSGNTASEVREAERGRERGSFMTSEQIASYQSCFVLFFCPFTRLAICWQPHLVKDLAPFASDTPTLGRSR